VTGGDLVQRRKVDLDQLLLKNPGSAKNHAHKLLIHMTSDLAEIDCSTASTTL